MGKWGLLLVVLMSGCNNGSASYKGRSGQPGEEILGVRFVYIPPGSFTMGSRYAEISASDADKKFFADESPPHQVNFTKGFWLSETEVTVAQFRRFVRETGYRTSAERRGESLGEYTVTTDAAGRKSGSWRHGKGLNWTRPGPGHKGDCHPVRHVSWEDAKAFCRWLSDKTGRSYRLPTEAEWEYAAGGPRHTQYSWGVENPQGARGGNIADATFGRAYPDWKYPVLVDYDDGHAITAPVGSYAPNGFGLFDMTGNVWEWVGDFYSPQYYLQSPASDPQGPAEPAPDPANPTARPRRVHRGGGFDWELPYLRVAKRRGAPEDASALHLGFRIARRDVGN